jgi:phosphate starvation-inducible protein PhoH and related proteins
VLLLTENFFKIEENIPLVEFLGIENANIKEIAAIFPNCRITSRGNEIFLYGNTHDVSNILAILEYLTEIYRKHKEINLVKLQEFLKNEATNYAEASDDTILNGKGGKVIKPKSINQAKIVEAIQKNDLVFALGPAGTGKTYVSVALAVRALKNKEVKRIVFTRPAVEAGENLGFLPGDLKEKIDPYIRPIYDALADMMDGEKLKQYQESNIIEIAPLAYMRGRTLSNAFILLDEAQNTTPMQLKMFLTRMGQGSKMIITGDKTQIDLPPKQKSGLIDAIEVLKGVKGIEFVELTGKDVTRHPLVREIIKAYDINDKGKPKAETDKNT